LIFLYRVIPGRAERSYGVYAAKLAGLPPPIVRRARELLREYEAGAHKARAVDARRTDGAELVNRLLELDLNSLSPVEALMKLYELQREAMLEAGKGRRAAK
jgi:DNA mismatch repair protein MutS